MPARDVANKSDDSLQQTKDTAKSLGLFALVVVILFWVAKQGD